MNFMQIHQAKHFSLDCETAKLIGSPCKLHKLTACYWTLLNIPASYRSKLSAIQLAAIVKTQDLKKHVSKALLLRNLESSLKLLAPGVNIDLPKKEMTTYYGMFKVVLLF